VAVAGFYVFAARVGSERFARWSSILLALSPWLLFLGGTQGNHLVTRVICKAPHCVLHNDGRGRGPGELRKLRAPTTEGVPPG
jgi:hypothetical protein